MASLAPYSITLGATDYPVKYAGLLAYIEPYLTNLETFSFSGGNVLLGTNTASGGRFTISSVANYNDLATGYSLVLSNTAGTGSNSNPINVGVIQFGNPLVTNNDLGRISVVQENPGAGTQASMRFFTNGGGGNAQTLERARITSAGDLLVGTTSNTINANGIVGQSNGVTKVTSTSDPLLVNRRSSTGSLVIFYNDSVLKGTISTDGTNVAYNTSSDYRLKDNQQPLTGSGAFIDALQPKTWEWKANGSKGVGFIAHEVQAVSPGSVVGEKDAVDADGKPVMQAMEYGSAEFIANIIAELQSLRARVAALEAA